MFFKIVLLLVKWLIWLLNGRIHIEGKENIPTDSGYVIAAPHHSWMDPVAIAIAFQPTPLIFMAKKELFQNPLFGWFIKKLGAFPVDRAKPGPSVIKYPVNEIKKNKKALLIFPSGTRHSENLKNGTGTIARLAKTPVVPAVYNGPLQLKNILKRQKMIVRIDKPIIIDSKEKLAEFNDVLTASYEKNDVNWDLFKDK
ncbi:MAG TPA: 1-acyl-sn-glycerol-3-phosphate acyltransferase [Bavariicoccus seileri]|uniref:1-acyl-sn-glycerol-3-phosphate acyltransferase n=1 Tax=Bavariicoccus seileri TaxID=549685 RepID=A0A3D4S3V6_9ENTE|nr:1-acyl-sn-glycerol-3-phosphate acyltransferase [Bavariicoccus seileri]HCS93316.1 1-acyl-sn-glycerol-3-phosphate acyltransferase [Bavariicoccus seileri]